MRQRRQPCQGPELPEHSPEVFELERFTCLGESEMTARRLYHRRIGSLPVRPELAPQSILPGFIRPMGSRAAFTARIMSSSSLLL